MVQFFIYAQYTTKKSYPQTLSSQSNKKQAILRQNMGTIVAYLRSHLKAIVVVAALVLAAGLLFSYFATPKKELAGRGSFTITDPALRAEQLKKLQQDSDADGLRDWAEVLYHTDPQKSDTDGDGTPDGEEVKLGRNPAAPGPDDLMATSTLTQDGPDGQSQNLTRQLALQIGTLLAQRAANPDLPFDSQTAENLVNNVVGTAPNEIPPSLTKKDIIIGNDSSKKAFQEYQLAFGKIFTGSFRHRAAKQDVEIFAEAMDAQDYEKLKALDQYVAGYDREIAQYKNLSVPSQLSSLHLEYINLAIAQKEVIRKLRNAGEDVVGATVVIGQYGIIQQRVSALGQKFQDEYQKVGLP